MDINRYIDYTNLNSFITKEDIKKLCDTAIKYHFESVCINPCYVELAKSLLEDSNVKVCTVIDYPLGNSLLPVKEYETISCIELGADEIDLVINIGALKDKDYDYVKEEIETVRDSIGGKVLKVVIESDLLNEEELKKIVEICNDTFVNFITINTDYNSNKLNKDIVDIINKYKNDILEIKINGNIDPEMAIKLIENGVSRIGTNNLLEKTKECKHQHCDCNDEHCKCEEEK